MCGSPILHAPPSGAAHRTPASAHDRAARDVRARTPGLLRAYSRPEQATAKLHRVDKCFKTLAELKANTFTHCEYCIDIGSQIARREA
jgi:hypothetical protein